mmetsp:Transcript_6423/g.9628  ORF Transcript_6423/g.9628 Transcript_6423/m.9628 type:complete len:284 (-) Transcript_6423:24-875(-)
MRNIESKFIFVVTSILCSVAESWVSVNHVNSPRIRSASISRLSNVLTGDKISIQTEKEKENLFDGKTISKSFQGFTFPLLHSSIFLSSILIHPVKVLACISSAGQKLHVGQKIALYLQSSTRLPDWATIMLISSMPVVELRGGIPVGLWMNLPIQKVLFLCVAGNMLPVPLILLALKSNFVQNGLKGFLDRARKKSASFGDSEKQLTALLFFVGIPLPGTGAWTGAMISSVLGMPFDKSVAAIFAGVLSAGIIMTALTLAGKVGAVVVSLVLAAFCGASFYKK